MPNSVVLVLVLAFLTCVAPGQGRSCHGSRGRFPIFAIHSGVWYDTPMVWCLTEGLPIEYVPMRDLLDLLHVPQWNPHWWTDLPTTSAADVLQQPWAFPEHTRRIAAANMSYPILVVNEPIFPGFAIADGNHRLARAYMENYTKVAIQRIPSHLLEEARLYDMTEVA